MLQAANTDLFNPLVPKVKNRKIRQFNLIYFYGLNL